MAPKASSAAPAEAEAKAAPADPLAALANAMRTGKPGPSAPASVAWRSAILGDERVEYVRGPDLATVLAKAGVPEIDAVAATIKNAGALPPPARAAAIANALLARRFLVRATRVYWKPRPGMERLAKWPKKLAMAPPTERAAFSPARHTFYAWTFDRPSSPYAWVYSALVVTAVLAACLFPLAPHWVKLAAFYASSGLLAALTALLTVRGALALATWLAAGRAVWLFPLLLDENTGLDKAFRPLYEVAPPPSGSRRVHLAARGVTAAALVAGVAATAVYAPIDRKGAGAGLRDAHDALLEALNLHHRGMDKLGDSSGSGNKTAGGGGGGSGGGGPGGGAKAATAGGATIVPPPPPPSTEDADGGDAGAAAGGGGGDGGAHTEL